MIEKLPKKWSRHSFIAFGEIIKDHIYVSNCKKPSNNKCCFIIHSHNKEITIGYDGEKYCCLNSFSIFLDSFEKENIIYFILKNCWAKCDVMAQEKFDQIIGIALEDNNKYNNLINKYIKTK